MAVVLGLDAKLFRGAAGSQGATEMKNVKNVTLNLTKGEADVTTRAASGWKVTAGTLKEASLEFEMNYNTGSGGTADADLAAVQTAYFSNTPIAFFVTTGDGHGLDADFSITEFSQEQPLEEAVSVKVTCKPTDAGRAPAWV